MTTGTRFQKKTLQNFQLFLCFFLCNFLVLPKRLLVFASCFGGTQTGVSSKSRKIFLQTQMVILTATEIASVLTAEKWTQIRRDLWDSLCQTVTELTWATGLYCCGMLCSSSHMSLAGCEKAYFCFGLGFWVSFWLFICFFLGGW